jgi:predicted nuclease of predicted toxin-antitoxin system
MTSFLVKLDENLGRSPLELVRSYGYDTESVHTQGLSGASDATLWSRVVAEGRFLITLDLDFSDVRRFEPGTHPGVLLIRGRSGSSGAVLEVLRRVAAEQPLEELTGCLAVADEGATRIRRPSDAPLA